MAKKELEAPNLQVDIAQADDVVCESCGNYTFSQVFLMKKVSALLSPNGREGIVPIPTFGCNACGFVNAQFLPVRGSESAPRPSLVE